MPKFKKQGTEVLTQYFLQQPMGEIMQELFKGLADSVRPVLTYFFAIVYMSVSTYGVFVDKIDFTIYFSQIGTLVGMMIAFWFGERSALKNPNGGSNA